jgi:phenolic acid decarboxylase
VKQYGELDVVLKVETGGLYEHKLIRLVEYVKDIYNLHNDFVVQKFRTVEERKLARECDAEEQEVINAAAVQGLMLTLEERKALDNA